ncbi:hypothetical protein WMF18_26820 [Sorangium sp. So ce315]|uniref:hypothetical protein n=1 Tax=Sorangium sp. So ce315 TaxID=3133299 RepID=UPI003F5EB0F8
MRSLPRLFCMALSAAAAALSAAAGCGFPDVTFTGDASTASAGGGAGGAAGSTTSSTSTSASPGAAGGGGDGGAASSSAGAGGEGGAVGSGGGGSGGDGGAAGSGGGGAAGSGGGGAAGSGGGAAGSGGGAASSSASASATASGSGGGGPVDCDVDRDGYRSTACEGGNDCNDENPDVHPGQPSTFYSTPIPTGGGFDYDCSGKEEREFEAVTCSNILPLCSAKDNVFQVDVPCGARAAFGDCGATCQFNPRFPDYIRKCH